MEKIAHKPISIEELPKVIKYNNKYYALNVHITAWGKLCISYKEFFEMQGERILSCIVEDKTQLVKNIDGIASSIDFERALTITKLRLQKHNIKEEKF